MKKFYSISDSPDPLPLVQQALQLKANPFMYNELGKGRSACFIFANPSLRTRLSIERAAQHLGLYSVVLNMNSDSWQLEYGDQVIMNGNKAEHIKEAAGVLGKYFDILAVRSFAELKSKEEDATDRVINGFIRYSHKPVINLESALGHPLQALADMMTIEEHRRSVRPKVVLSWAPHPKALPQAVPNSFASWSLAMGYDLTIVQPKGYELDSKFTTGARVVYDQKEAFEKADFVYTKNWSASLPYGQVLITDNAWMVDEEKMSVTDNARFMHCLPVRRNVVVSDGVLDSERSLVLDQAENRIYSAQAVLFNLLQVKNGH